MDGDRAGENGWWGIAAAEMPCRLNGGGALVNAGVAEAEVEEGGEVADVVDAVDAESATEVIDDVVAATADAA